MPAHSVSPVSSVAQALDRWRGGDRVEVLRSEFLDVLASVPDPRDPRGRRYPLEGLLAIAILATAAGMGAYAGFATWAAHRADRRCSANWGSGFGDQARRRSERYFNDWIRPIWTAGSAPISPRWPRRGSRRGQVAGGRSGRQDAARGAAGRSGRRAPGVGVRPPRPAGARPARRRREEQRNPLCAKDSQAVPAGAAAGHGGRDAHPDRDREADLRHPEIALPDDRQVQSAQAAGPHHRAAVGARSRSRPPTTRTATAASRRRTLKVLTAARGIGFPYAKQIIQITRERVTAATGERTREVVYAICSLPFEHARPAMIAAWLRGHWGIENMSIGSAT